MYKTHNVSSSDSPAQTSKHKLNRVKVVSKKVNMARAKHKNAYMQQLPVCLSKTNTVLHVMHFAVYGCSCLHINILLYSCTNSFLLQSNAHSAY